MGSGDTNTIGRGESQSTPPEGTVCFEDIIAAERKAIAERRGYVKRTKTEAGQGEGGDPADPSTNVVKPFSGFGAPVGETDDLIQDTIGLSLVGWRHSIRSFLSWRSPGARSRAGAGQGRLSLNRLWRRLYRALDARRHESERRQVSISVEVKAG
jgi:hypothetical protein